MGQKERLSYLVDNLNRLIVLKIRNLKVLCGGILAGERIWQNIRVPICNAEEVTSC